MFRHILAFQHVSRRTVASTARRQVDNKISQNQKRFQVRIHRPPADPPPGAPADPLELLLTPPGAPADPPGAPADPPSPGAPADPPGAPADPPGAPADPPSPGAPADPALLVIF
ncbi:hypothetical protein NHX12_026357 [Muraenolepis orangiensis]|uniref:Uncharacterized protein n=1 Tax=Muraenolepis orangiensis TaxID=630683 RepID=A0A9Q0IQN1_9TELE|nr:hypothetical protein NHX12_026357 [Muraenolepis orangiensis]